MKRLIFILLMMPASAWPQTVGETHPEMIFASMQPHVIQDCILDSYKFVGMCLWANCADGICVPTAPTPKVEHYTFGGLVSVFPELYDNPIFEDAILYGLVNESLTELNHDLFSRIYTNEAPLTKAGSGYSQTLGGRAFVNLERFKSTLHEATVYAHPLAQTPELMAPAGLPVGTWLLTFPVGPMFTKHFDSGWNLGQWRWGLFDQFLPSAILGLEQVGTPPLWSWGPLLPRIGWQSGHSQQDPRTAAVVAARAWDIAVNSSRRMLGNYIPIEYKDGVVKGIHYENTDELVTDVQWLLLYPNQEIGSLVEDLACHKFGETLEFPWYSEADIADVIDEFDIGSGRHIWAAFPRVRGCHVTGNTLLEDFDF